MSIHRTSGKGHNIFYPYSCLTLGSSYALNMEILWAGPSIGLLPVNNPGAIIVQKKEKKKNKSRRNPRGLLTGKKKPELCKELDLYPFPSPLPSLFVSFVGEVAHNVAIITWAMFSTEYINTFYFYLFIIHQVRCIIRNIVRDWAFEVLTSSKVFLML